MGCINISSFIQMGVVINTYVIHLKCFSEICQKGLRSCNGELDRQTHVQTDRQIHNERDSGWDWLRERERERDIQTSRQTLTERESKWEKDRPGTYIIILSIYCTSMQLDRQTDRDIDLDRHTCRKRTLAASYKASLSKQIKVHCYKN